MEVGGLEGEGHGGDVFDGGFFEEGGEAVCLEDGEGRRRDDSLAEEEGEGAAEDGGEEFPDHVGVDGVEEFSAFRDDGGDLGGGGFGVEMGDGVEEFDVEGGFDGAAFFEGAVFSDIVAAAG